MSAQPPPALEGTQAPSQIEFLWERYRPLAWTILAAVLVALAGNYGWKYFQQKATDTTWSAFSAETGLDEAYTKEQREYVQTSLTEELRSSDLSMLEAAVATANEAQKPFLLLAIARKSMLDAKWDRAESALAEIESKYPTHSLVMSTNYPIQIREQLDPKAKPTNPQKPPDLKPAVAGSAVARMREEIGAARAYTRPAQFQWIEPVADAKKVKFDFSNGSSFTIALMPEQAPKHVEAFLKFAAEGDGGFWKSMAVDEIHRPTEFAGQPREMHLGFASTREDDRTKWTTTDPSSQPLDFEPSSLSHFPGAVSGRNEADGKSCADRFWIVADDAPRFDGERSIFGYVVEGLDQVKRICDESMSAQDEQAGRGRPTENIRVTSVTVMP
jgi:cyclophilin family peptidyl-prolyl cis-trans isomerase